MRYFTVVGSRLTPEPQAKILRDFSERLLRAGWTGRSGLSGEADLALNRALDRYDGLAELYIPWDFFNGYSHGDLAGRVIYPKRLDNSAQATAVMTTLHPVWTWLSPGAKSLHARNVYQVLGKDLASPSDVLFCWAPVKGGYVQGGTATAYNLAVQSGVPVFNIAVPGQLKLLDAWIETAVADKTDIDVAFIHTVTTNPYTVDEIKHYIPPVPYAELYDKPVHVPLRIVDVQSK